MSKMLPQFNALVLDVIVIVLLLSLIALGVFKGIKHIAINFVLLIGSIALSFTSVTNVLKVQIVQLLSSNIKLGIGVGDEVKLGIYVAYTFIAALILTILFYVILRLLKYLIVVLIKRNMLKNNKLPKITTKLSRIFGGIFSLVFNGALFIVMLCLFTTPLIGGNKTSDSSYVTKHIVKLDDLLLDAISEDELLQEKIMVKLVKGDLIENVDDETAKSFKGLSELVNSNKLTPENLDNPQEIVNSLHDVLYIVVNHGLDENKVEIDGFEKVVELTRNMANASVNAINGLHTSEEKLVANNTLATYNLLVELGLQESADIFERVFQLQ